MKKLITLAVFALLFSCNDSKKEQPKKDYVVLSGKVINPVDTLQLVLYNVKADKYIVPEIDENGNFQDTLKLAQPTFYNSYYGNKFFKLFLTNGVDLKINFDTQNFGKTIAFEGEGSLPNSLLRKKSGLSSDMFGEDYRAFLSLEKAVFEQKMDTYVSSYSQLLEKNKKELDTSFYNKQTAELSTFKENMLPMYERQQKINEQLAKGNPSPVFTDYVNYKGGTSSISDFEGKYLYIDLWATWCGPCKVQIPYLEKRIEEYKGKNIQFVSISIDDPKTEDRWRQMIKEKEMSGVQLLADAAYQSQFVQDYFIQGIPRYILLDPQGNIISHDAPRPSDPKLIDLLESLNI